VGRRRGIREGSEGLVTKTVHTGSDITLCSSAPKAISSNIAAPTRRMEINPILLSGAITRGSPSTVAGLLQSAPLITQVLASTPPIITKVQNNDQMKQSLAHHSIAFHQHTTSFGKKEKSKATG
jgi:hypothetical protein